MHLGIAVGAGVGQHDEPVVQVSGLAQGGEHDPAGGDARKDKRVGAGGTVTMPMQKQVWGDEFGMCVDQFGVSWLVNISQPQS